MAEWKVCLSILRITAVAPAVRWWRRRWPSTNISVSCGRAVPKPTMTADPIR